MRGTGAGPITAAEGAGRGYTGRVRASGEPFARRRSRWAVIAPASAFAGLLVAVGTGAVVLVDPGTLRSLAPALLVVAGVGLAATLYAFRLALRRTR